MAKTIPISVIAQGLEALMLQETLQSEIVQEHLSPE
jgi:hypothetical protein